VSPERKLKADVFPGRKLNADVFSNGIAHFLPD